ncbi:MAG: hypothetical protein HY869_01485 [Chloroflexi bacterium]|nr:hypothetical protein [Chloroflexota bacterium]
MQKRLGILLNHRYAPPLLLAAVMVFAYGLVMTQTGFYWDDLPMSWIRYQLGPQAMAQYFSTNRPVWGLLYQVTTRIFPQDPLYWQAFALFWRWMGAVLAWLVARELWPRRKSFSLAVGLLFLVYPGFSAQWAAYLYSHFFIVLCLFLFSLYCSLKTIARPSRAWMAAGLIASALNLWMMEYFFLLELTRVLLLWIALRDEVPAASQRTRRTLGLWAPYLAVFAAAVLSRFFIFNNQVYGIGLLPRLQADPLGTLTSLAQTALTSLWTVSFAAWGQAFQLPNPVVHGPRTLALYAGVLALVLGAVAALFWWRQDEDPGKRWEGGWFVALGLVMLPFASAPFWLTDLPVALAFPANRATLPSMLGVAFILAGLIELLRWPIARHTLLAVLVALAAGRQLLWGLDFSRDWQAQKNLFWQMTWRAPGLEPGTTVLLNDRALTFPDNSAVPIIEKPLAFEADNSLSAALNWVYAPNNHSAQVDYVLFYPKTRLGGSLAGLEPGLPIRYDYLAGIFNGNTSQVVAFYYAPPACLRVLDPILDGYNRWIPEDTLMREAAALSSAGWIRPEETAVVPSVYGPEPTHGWCYYFERADLARQMGAWEQVVEIAQTAFALDDYPNDPTERFVYIEGYAHIDDWANAVNYSIQSHRVSPGYVDPMLCRLWDRIEAETPDSAEKAAALEEVKTKFSCLP